MSLLSDKILGSEMGSTSVNFIDEDNHMMTNNLWISNPLKQSYEYGQLCYMDMNDDMNIDINDLSPLTDTESVTSSKSYSSTYQHIHYQYQCRLKLKQKQSQNDKSKSLPCRSFLATGACPYQEKCVYIHDNRIATTSIQQHIRMKNQEVVASDSFFYPPLTAYQKSQNYDQYSVPKAPKLVGSKRYVENEQRHTQRHGHDQGKFNNNSASIASIWGHYVKFCHDSTYATTCSDDIGLGHPNDTKNQITFRPRIKILRQLGMGMDMNTHIKEKKAENDVSESEYRHEELKRCTVTHTHKQGERERRNRKGEKKEKFKRTPVAVLNHMHGFVEET